MNDPRTTTAVALGAAVGAGLRWAIVELFPPATGWPWAILLVNLVGTFALGVIVMVQQHVADEQPSVVWLALGTGVCGALTTFSSFAVDMAQFMRDNRTDLTANYFLASVGGGIVVFVIGRFVGERVSS